jgi:hypothetical protein
MRLLGTIVRLQYQRDHLKKPGPFGKQYDPVNIVPVEALEFTPDGVVSGPANDPHYDVHHTNHPRSRNRGDNGISFGFTGHYAAMRDRFGERLADGIAGENILIERTGIMKTSEFAGGLVVETIDGPIGIGSIKVAAPCVEFSRFAMEYPADAAPDRRVTETLVFLNSGMRGFYASVEATATFRVGDRVYFRD